MSARAILMMLVILAVVWGGFVGTLVVAMSREKKKSQAQRGD